METTTSQSAVALFGSGASGPTPLLPSLPERHRLLLLPTTSSSTTMQSAAAARACDGCS